jgi:hypothetical protein
LQSAPEAALDELVSRDQLTPKVRRDEKKGYDHPSDDVSDSQLQEAKILFVSKSRNADDGERTGLGRHN